MRTMKSLSFLYRSTHSQLIKFPSVVHSPCVTFSRSARTCRIVAKMASSLVLRVSVIGDVCVSGIRVVAVRFRAYQNLVCKVKTALSL